MTGRWSYHVSWSVPCMPNTFLALAQTVIMAWLYSGLDARVIYFILISDQDAMP